jgi:hypothetical protein
MRNECHRTDGLISLEGDEDARNTVSFRPRTEPLPQPIKGSID